MLTLDNQSPSRLALRANHGVLVSSDFERCEQGSSQCLPIVDPLECGSYLQTINVCKLLAYDLKTSRELDIVIIASWHKAHGYR